MEGTNARGGDCPGVNVRLPNPDPNPAQRTPLQAM